MRAVVSAAVGIVTFFAVVAVAAEPKTHTVQKIAEDVYLLQSREAGLNSNTLVIVNKDDVLLVDSHNDPRAAGQLVADLKTITAKPVRYVVNTHYHFDHAGGNEVFGPGVEIIGSVFTHYQLSNKALQGRTAVEYLGPQGFQATRTANLKKALAGETDAAKKATMQKQIAELEASSASAAKEVETPPTIVVKDKLILFRGGREIQIIHPGRGHTGGDLLVYLPKERIVATGDFFLTLPSCCGFMGDFYPPEFAKSFEVLKALDFETIVPGHGPTLAGDEARRRVVAWQMYLIDFWNQVSASKKQGLSALEASRKLDMTAHKAALPGTPSPSDFKGDKPIQAVARAYELLEGNDYYGNSPH